MAHPCLATPRRRRPTHEATITLDAGAAIELADILDLLLAEWIAEDDDDPFAGHAYTTNELNALLTNLSPTSSSPPQLTLDTT